MVVFSYLNLAKGEYPSSINGTDGMDVIFCRNVLMYFSPERARSIVDRFWSALADGGWLIVASSELSQDIFSQFGSVQFPGAIVYRKIPERERARQS